MTNVITARQIRNWAQEIATIINNRYAVSGESKIFEHDFTVGNDVFTATVSYKCDVHTDEGTCYAPSSWWVDDERTTIERVTDGNGNACPKLIDALEYWLN